MIARIWCGRAQPAKASGYVRHFSQSVVPSLKKLDGHRGAWLLQREAEGTTEFLALTLWDSCESIRAFAGIDVEKAHVEPEARAVLSDFDDFAQHYAVAFTSL
jgi:heme-degrading monooxygenase HmoA